MERGSDKHAPRIDEEMAEEVAPLTTGLHASESRVEEFREQEGAADWEPSPDSRLAGGRGSASPDLLSYDEVEARSELATNLQPSVFPATRDELMASARQVNAPEHIIGKLSLLPEGTFDNLEAVWEAMGGREDFRGA